LIKETLRAILVLRLNDRHQSKKYRQKNSKNKPFHSKTIYQPETATAKNYSKGTSNN
jgi:purine nucleoside permease